MMAELEQKVAAARPGGLGAMAAASTPTAEEQVRRSTSRRSLGRRRRSRSWSAKPSFGVLLARSAENVAALTRISADVADLVLRNLRLAGRADITRLARQLHRTEDKLERVLQESGGSCATSSRRSDRASRGDAATVDARTNGRANGQRRRRRERDRNAGPRAARHVRVRERDPDDPRRRDRRRRRARSSGPIAGRRSTATGRRSASTRFPSCSCSR